MILVKTLQHGHPPFAAFSNITQYFHLCKYFLRQQRLVDIALADAAVLCHQLHRFLPVDPLLLIDFHMLLERQVLPSSSALPASIPQMSFRRLSGHTLRGVHCLYNIEESPRMSSMSFPSYRFVSSLHTVNLRSPSVSYSSSSVRIR